MKVKDAVSLLKEKGYRTTPQRVAVLKALIGNKNHPTADDLFKVASRNYRSVSLATVYNVLQMLERENLVRSHSFTGSGLHYDPDISDHAHFVCSKCCKVYDLSINALSRAVILNSLKSGFKIIGYEIVLHGICETCLQSQQEIG